MKPTLKDAVFSIYEKTINKIDDLTEYNNPPTDVIRSILKDMNEDIEKLRKE